MWLPLILLVVLPVALLVDLFLARHPGRGDWMLASGLVASYLLFVALVGRWDLFSTHLPYLYFVLFLIALYLPSRRPTRGGRPTRVRGPGPRASLAGRLGVSALTVALLVGSWIAYGGRAAPEELPSLVFPLRDGTYFVSEGGGARIINAHRADRALPAGAEGIDIVKLNRWGGRAAGIFPRHPERHAIFGVPIRSPCAGKVLDAVDGHPDEGTSGSRYGNHVVLECDAGNVVLAHMQRESVAVEAGEEVRTGDLLGRVGSSGDSRAPGLHIHVEVAGSPAGAAVGDAAGAAEGNAYGAAEGNPDGAADRNGGGAAVRVQYEGRVLVRGQVFRSGPIID